MNVSSKSKKAILSDGLSLDLMSGSLWRASCPPPSGPLLRNVQIRSRRICPTREGVHRQTADKTKGPVFRLSLLFYLMSGSSLLSHGETPHYHRRYGVSLLSSAWGHAWGDPTLPSALRRFTSEFGMGSGGTTALLPPDKFFSNLPNFNLKSGADTQSRTGDLTLTKGALYQLSHISTLNLMPGSSLLSHGETPHYHRRYGVSLLSSASALRRFTSEFGMGSGGTTALRPPGKFCFIRPLLRSDLICIRLKIFSQSAKTSSAL